MRLRKLRIAWSVVWGIAGVLLIVLWVRNYWWSEGLFRVYRRPHLWHFDISSNSVLDEGAIPAGLQKSGIALSRTTFTGPERPFAFESYTGGGGQVRVPTWLALSGLLAAAIVPCVRWRFSLRTLLIATTLVAIVLGLAVWAAK